MRVCDYVVTTYFCTAFSEVGIIDEDRNTIILFLKCELFGLCIDWINTGMPGDAIVKLKHITAVCNGMIEDMINRCQNGKMYD